LLKAVDVVRRVSRPLLAVRCQLVARRLRVRVGSYFAGRLGGGNFGLSQRFALRRDAELFGRLVAVSRRMTEPDSNAESQGLRSIQSERIVAAVERIDAILGVERKIPRFDESMAFKPPAGRAVAASKMRTRSSQS